MKKFKMGEQKGGTRHYSLCETLRLPSCIGLEEIPTEGRADLRVSGQLVGQVFPYVSFPRRVDGFRLITTNPTSKPKSFLQNTLLPALEALLYRITSYTFTE